MRFVTSNFDIEVKYKKAGNELLVPKPPIRLKIANKNGEVIPIEELRVVEEKSRRFLWKGKEVSCEMKFVDPETQKEVPSCDVLEVLEHYVTKLLTPAGTLVEKEGEGSQYVELLPGGAKYEVDLLYFAVQPDGSELPCSPFTRTDVLEIKEENWIPSTTIEQFLITNVYEVFSPNREKAAKLYEECEKRLKQDKIGVTSFSWGNGFVQYYCFMVPHIENGKFVWLLKLTDTKVAYNNLQDIPGMKLPIREAPPTLTVLPPIQALVVPQQKKKKQQSS